MEELRAALLRLFAESIGVADELSDEEESVLDAWNEYAREHPVPADMLITRRDIDAMFDD